MVYSAVMTQEEKRARLANATLEYAELKQQVNLLEDEFLKVGRFFESVVPVFRRGEASRILDKLSEMPDKAALVESAEKLKQAKGRLEELKDLLAPYGLAN